MKDGRSIAGALEGGVHIPQKYPLRDGSLSLAVAMTMLAVTMILLLVCLISMNLAEKAEKERSAIGDDHRWYYRENDAKYAQLEKEEDDYRYQAFVTAFAGLALFFVTLPVLFSGSLGLFRGRKQLSGRPRAMIITGFVLFIAVFFTLLFAVPIYFFVSLSQSHVSSAFQTFSVLLSGLLLLSIFLEVLPQSPGRNRGLVLSGFIVMMVPTGLMTLIALISVDRNGFFLSPIPHYLMNMLYFFIVGIAMFLLFRKFAGMEGMIQPSAHVTRRPALPDGEGGEPPEESDMPFIHPSGQRIEENPATMEPIPVEPWMEPIPVDPWVEGSGSGEAPVPSVYDKRNDRWSPSSLFSVKEDRHTRAYRRPKKPRPGNDPQGRYDGGW